MKEEYVDIGGRRLRLRSAGEGAPVVILEAGAGGFSAVWGRVFPEVAKFARVVAYDRAGLGRSDPPPVGEPRTSGNAVRDLHALLSAADVAPPYVLVGHSYGGFHVRLYASRFPEEVAGLVLVDADVEEEWTRVVPDEHRKGLDFMTRVIRVLRRTAGFGLPQMLVRMWAPLSIRKLPGREMREMVRLGFTARALHTVQSEFENLDTSSAELRAAQRDLGNRPLVVIRHGIAPMRPPGVSREDARAVEKAIASMQRRMSLWSRRGRLIVAEHSRHDIHIDEPHIVIDAIRDVVRIIRAESGLDSRGRRLT